MEIDMVFNGFPFTIDNDLKRTGMFALRPASPDMPLALNWWPVTPNLTFVFRRSTATKVQGPIFTEKKQLKYFKILISGTINDFLF